VAVCASAEGVWQPTIAGGLVDEFVVLVSGYRAGSIVVRITVWFLPLGRT
jgi:hypothetical protein